MTSVVDVCNLALSHLGDRATVASIDPPEGSAQAEHCARFWPIARDDALSSHDWTFARRTADLAQLLTEDHPSWGYAYAMPNDFLVARRIVWPDGQQIALWPGDPHFEIGTKDDGTQVLYTNAPSAALVYTRRISDPTRYSAKFVVAAGYLLASYLAGPVIKGRAGVATAQAMLQRYQIELGGAQVADANQSHQSLAFQPSALAARGTSVTRTIEDGPYRRELPYWAQG